MKAEKGLIQDIFSYLIFGFILVFMLSAIVLFSNISDNTHYSKYSANVFERYGMCSAEALSELETYSLERFNGRYDVESCNQTGTGYGSVINFRVKGKFNLLFIDTPFNLHFGGTSTINKRTY